MSTAVGAAGCACCCAANAVCCGLRACRCCSCKRGTSTVGYLLLVVLSVIVAGTLKFGISPALISNAQDGVVINVTTVGAAARIAEDKLFYSISDCATRVRDWRPSVDTLVTEDFESDLRQCVGNFLVYRVSCGITIVFFLMSVITLAQPTAHNGCWGAKLLIFFALVVAGFFVPNVFFYGYSYLARIMTFIFILLQMVILVDFAFDWSEDFQDKFEATGNPGDTTRVLRCTLGNTGVKVLYLVASALLILVGIVGSGLLFGYYKGCDENLVIITFTFLFGLVSIVTGVVSCKGQRDTGDDGDDGTVGLLVPAVVFCTCVYYAFSSVKNNPNEHCNPTKQSNNDAASIVLGLLLTSFSLVWVTARTANSAPSVLTTKMVDEQDGDEVTAGPADVEVGMSAEEQRERKREERERKREERKRKRQKKKKKKKKKNSNEIAGPDEVGSSDNEDDADGAGGAPVGALQVTQGPDADDAEQGAEPMTADERVTVRKKMWLFHLIMSFGGLYLAMILTQWGDYTGLSEEENTANKMQAVWVNAVGGWVAYALFAWIRVAPRCCPDRDFSDVQRGF